jgi:molybdopterin biosynthesis enzyme
MPPLIGSGSGYACRREDLDRDLEVLEVIRQYGSTKAIGKVNAQTDDRAYVPQGADTVIMVELY